MNWNAATTQIFCDMDGVLADFDAGHEKVFGVRPCKINDNVEWDKIRAIEGYYRDLPPMADFDVLWRYIEPFNPIILTGVPWSVTEAEANKRAWVDKHIGTNIRMIGCKSAEKSLHMQPGDILIDDWDKYRHLWLAKGGRWVLHTSALNSIQQLIEIGF